MRREKEEVCWFYICPTEAEAGEMEGEVGGGGVIGGSHGTCSGLQVNQPSDQYCTWGIIGTKIQVASVVQW